MLHARVIRGKRFVKEIPETKPDPKGFAYVLLLHFLMLEIWDVIPLVGRQYRQKRQDRANPLNQTTDDPGFKDAHRYTTIAPMGWEDCIPLQPADLLENLKEAESKNSREETQENS